MLPVSNKHFSSLLNISNLIITNGELFSFPIFMRRLVFLLILCFFVRVHRSLVEEITLIRFDRGVEICISTLWLILFWNGVLFIASYNILVGVALEIWIIIALVILIIIALVILVVAAL